MCIGSASVMCAAEVGGGIGIIAAEVPAVTVAADPPEPDVDVPEAGAVYVPEPATVVVGATRSRTGSGIF